MRTFAGGGMKLLIVGRLNAWMGLHMRQFAEGFRAIGHEPVLLDYRKCRKRTWLRRARDADVSAQTRILEEFVRESGAEAIVVAPAHSMFDFAQLRSGFRGPILFLDMDGPNLPWYAGGTEWIRDVDVLVTVSQVTARELRAQGLAHVHYLPHGVDPNFYAPMTLTQAERQKFAAPIVSVGHPTERRVSYLSHLDQGGLALWGRDWVKRPFKQDKRLEGSVRKGVDVVGPDLVKVYNASRVVVCVQREVLCDPPTIMNLQVFAVPSSGGCLLTEWVEEIEDAFEPDRELLTFRSPEELAEKARRVTADVDVARKIGERGRQRCLAEHTHEHRARQLAQLMGL